LALEHLRVELKRLRGSGVLRAIDRRSEQEGGGLGMQPQAFAQAAPGGGVVLGVGEVVEERLDDLVVGVLGEGPLEGVRGEEQARAGGGVLQGDQLRVQEMLEAGGEGPGGHALGVLEVERIFTEAQKNKPALGRIREGMLMGPASVLGGEVVVEGAALAGVQKLRSWELAEEVEDLSGVASGGVVEGLGALAVGGAQGPGGPKEGADLGGGKGLKDRGGLGGVDAALYPEEVGALITEAFKEGAKLRQRGALGDVIPEQRQGARGAVTLQRFGPCGEALPLICCGCGVWEREPQLEEELPDAVFPAASSRAEGVGAVVAGQDGFRDEVVAEGGFAGARRSGNDPAEGPLAEGGSGQARVLSDARAGERARAGVEAVVPEGCQGRDVFGSCEGEKLLEGRRCGGAPLRVGVGHPLEDPSVVRIVELLSPVSLWGRAVEEGGDGDAQGVDVCGGARCTLKGLGGHKAGGSGDVR
jgi:hypothetical protein